MTTEDYKDDGPSCACGRVDIYKEMLKSKEKNKEEVSDSNTSDGAGDDTSTDETDKED